MNLQIYVTHHRPGRIVSNRVVVPIQGGKALSRVELGIQGDDSGENISKLNPYYSELTTQYWVWKNCPGLDYVGFMHYRRHFLFGDPQRPVNPLGGCVNVPCRDARYERMIGLDDPAIVEELVRGCDLVLPPPFPIRNWDSQTVIDQLGTIPQLNRRPGFNRPNVERAMRVVQEQQPDYAEVLHEVFFETGGEYYLFNSYVMRWEFFDGYNRWLFPLLEAIHRELDYSGLSPGESRLLGFLAERLFNVYLRHYQQTVGKLVIRHVPITFLEEGVWWNLGQGNYLAAVDVFARKLQVAWRETRMFGPVVVLKRVLHLPTHSRHPGLPPDAVAGDFEGRHDAGGKNPS